MAIENDKLVTLAGLAEYNKSIPNISKAALLMSMESPESFSEDPNVYKHIVGYQLINMQEDALQLSIPADAKYMVVSISTIASRTITPTSVNYTYDWCGSPISRDIIDSTELTYFLSNDNTICEDGSILIHPCAYIATDGNLDLDKYQNPGNLTLINEPAWLTYDTTSGRLVIDEVLRDSYNVSGSSDLVTPFETDLMAEDGSYPIIGMVYSTLFDGQLTAANQFYNKYDGRNTSPSHAYGKNSGIIAIDENKTYWLYSYNMPEDYNYSTGDSPLCIKVFYFDHFGIARMYSNEDMIDADKAWAANQEAAAT